MSCHWQTDSQRSPQSSASRHTVCRRKIEPKSLKHIQLHMGNNRSGRLAWLAWSIIAAVIIIDQAIKIWIKTHFYLGEDYEIFSWFHLRFVQNNGMAFGLEVFNKYFLTFFRIALFGFLSWYICKLCKRATVPIGYLVCVSLVAAGAIGNIIDCVFYGEMFTNPYPPLIANIVPFGEGYGSWFQGLVVDMFYFPLFSFTWPEFLPWIGGKTFSFFDPVFNFADAAISVGMIAIILFYYKLLENSLENEKTDKNKRG